MSRSRIHLLVWALAGAAWLAPPLGVTLPAATGRVAIQEADPDTLPDAPAAADTTESPGDTLSASQDTMPRLRDLPTPPPPDSSFGLRRYHCDRACLLDHNVLGLADLLEMVTPELTMLRGSYFAGPHHVRSGGLGGGFTEIRLDGRPLPPLAGGQVDLARVPVNRLDQVTVSETPLGLAIDATPVRRTEPEAYSRVSAATGTPNVDMIHALFTNGLGRNLSVSTGIDLLNTSGPGAGGDRFDFWGNLAWLPGEDGAGVELQWRNQSLDRRGTDTLSVDRQELHLLGRGRVGEEIWITLSAGNSRREASQGGTSVGDETEERQITEVDAASVEVRAGTGPGFLEARAEARDGVGQPSMRVRTRGGLEFFDALRLAGGIGASRWDRFDGWTAELGALYRPGLGGVDLELGAGGAAGVRGVPRPLLGRADSLTFRQGQARASAAWGPVAGTVRGSYQDLSRQLPFGGTLDPGLEPGGSVKIGGIGGSLEAPLIPLSWLGGGEVEPIRLTGTWHHQEILEEGGEGTVDTVGTAAPADLYLPADQARVAVVFHDRFFREDLEVRAEIAGRYRSAMTTVDPASGETGRVSGWTTADWNLMVKIKDLRVWWRVDNTRGAPWEDLVGIVRPLRRNIFGVKWEFTN